MPPMPIRERLLLRAQELDRVASEAEEAGQLTIASALRTIAAEMRFIGNRNFNNQPKKEN
jgi:hypothetical protein